MFVVYVKVKILTKLAQGMGRRNWEHTVLRCLQVSSDYLNIYCKVCQPRKNIFFKKMNDMSSIRNPLNTVKFKCLTFGGT